jgi:hypothetical protein
MAYIWDITVNRTAWKIEAGSAYTAVYRAVRCYERKFGKQKSVLVDALRIGKAPANIKGVV